MAMLISDCGNSNKTGRVTESKGHIRTTASITNVEIQKETSKETFTVNYGNANTRLRQK